MMRPETPITEKLLRTTAAYVAKLRTLDIRTVGDLLRYLPRDYEDRSEERLLFDLLPGETNVSRVRIGSVASVRTARGKPMLQAVITDREGAVAQAVWFNQPHIKALLSVGSEYILAGKVALRFGRYVFQSPDIEPVGAAGIRTGRVIARYPEVDTARKHGVRLGSDWFAGKMLLVREAARHFTDPLPSAVRTEYNLMALPEAIERAHFPASQDEGRQALRRLSFDALFTLQVNALYRRERYRHEAVGHGHAIGINTQAIKDFLSRLPFTLTDGQKIVLYQCLRDMEKPFPMLRLLQGDVGSGKTAVAAALAHHVIASGRQVALLAPTEVLSTQHYETVAPLFASEERPVALLTGSTPEKERKRILSLLTRPDGIGFLIGTHALLQDDVSFANLGLVIIDEQHRFGVEQRKKLAALGYPHVLHMTATPIPRTLALTAYGDQDISSLRERPAGRTPVITRIITPERRQQAYGLIMSEVEKGHQAYVLCPLVDPSDANQAKAATAEVRTLRESSLGRYRIDCLHGRLKPAEKAATMRAFAQGELDILVATSVIEVGISVSNATVMMIEGADRFGLSQLHQLRGRVGRGQAQSYCLLCSETPSEDALRRLRVLEETQDGFRIAEEDLRLRGAGQLYGVRQSGLPDLPIGTDLDTALVEQARTAAENVLRDDPLLEQHPALRALIRDESALVLG